MSKCLNKEQSPIHKSRMNLGTRSDSKRRITQNSELVAPFPLPSDEAAAAAAPFCASFCCVKVARSVSNKVPILVQTVPPPHESSARTAGAVIGRLAPFECHHVDGKTNLSTIQIGMQTRLSRISICILVC
jgi:hypothetical protein